MGDIVSLKLHRKRRARADKAQSAAENRLRFGQTKHEREREAAEREKAEKDLDGHKR